jgi:hypothetical protein
MNPPFPKSESGSLSESEATFFKENRRIGIESTATKADPDSDSDPDENAITEAELSIAPIPC